MKVGKCEEIPMPDHIAEQFENNYVDNRAIKGQYALNYIMQEQEVYDKIQKAWFHFLVSGEVTHIEALEITSLFRSVKPCRYRLR